MCTYVRENRNYGSTSFDNIFTGILSIFVAITLEGWSVSALVSSVPVCEETLAYISVVC